MFNDPDFRKNLIVSLITSILVLVFIEPLLKIVASGMMWLGANISASFTRSVYLNAAFGLREKYSFITLMFLISILAGVMFGRAFANRNALRQGRAASENPTKKNLISALVTCTFVISSSHMMAVNFIEMQLNASFNQRLTVLAAKVEEQQVKELKAMWALMEGREDYERLLANMNNIAREKNVKLPAALWE